MRVLSRHCKMPIRVKITRMGSIFRVRKRSKIRVSRRRSNREVWIWSNYRGSRDSKSSADRLSQVVIMNRVMKLRRVTMIAKPPISIMESPKWASQWSLNPSLSPCYKCRSLTWVDQYLPIFSCRTRMTPKQIPSQTQRVKSLSNRFSWRIHEIMEMEKIKLKIRLKFKWHKLKSLQKFKVLQVCHQVCPSHHQILLTQES